MKSLTAALITESNKLASTGAWLCLLSVDIADGTILRLTPHPTSLTFDGVLYQPWPMQIDQVQQDSKGGLADVTVALSNVTREISAYLEAHDVRGRRVTMQYVHSANLADASAIAVDERYEITAVRVRQDVATFVLGHERMESHVFPGGRFLRDHCRWIYKSSECGYAGARASCDKILEGANGCRAHSNIPRYGGFPLLPGVTGRLT